MLEPLFVVNYSMSISRLYNVQCHVLMRLTMKYVPSESRRITDGSCTQPPKSPSTVSEDRKSRFASGADSAKEKRPRVAKRMLSMMRVMLFKIAVFQVTVSLTQAFELRDG